MKWFIFWFVFGWFFTSFEIQRIPPAPTETPYAPERGDTYG